MGNEIPQEPLQSGRHRLPHRWRPGESGNPEGGRSWRLKLQDKIDAFAAPYGGVAALAPDELELLRQAAILSTRHVGDTEQQVRVANALKSIFELLADRYRSKPRSLPNVSEGDITAASW